MSVSQISVFLESKPGHLRRVLDSFEERRRERAGLQRVGHGGLRHRALHRRRPLTPPWPCWQDRARPPRRPRCCACGWTTARASSPGSWASWRTAASTSRTATRSSPPTSRLSVKDLARAEELLAHEPVGLIGQDSLAQPFGAAEALRRSRRRAVRRMADLTVKGAALAAVAAGDFADLPIHDPAVECASREQIRAVQLEKLKAQVAWTYERVPWYRARMDASAWRRTTSARSRTCGSFRSRTRPCCAKRSPTACSPCQWTRWWNCTALVGHDRQAHRGGLQRPRHGRVERLHRAPGPDGRRGAGRPGADGVRLRHVHRRLRPALRAAEARPHDDPGRLAGTPSGISP